MSISRCDLFWSLVVLILGQHRHLTGAKPCTSLSPILNFDGSQGGPWNTSVEPQSVECKEKYRGLLIRTCCYSCCTLWFLTRSFAILCGYENMKSPFVFLNSWLLVRKFNVKHHGLKLTLTSECNSPHKKSEFPFDGYHMPKSPSFSQAGPGHRGLLNACKSHPHSPRRITQRTFCSSTFCICHRSSRVELNTEPS